MSEVPKGIVRLEFKDEPKDNGFTMELMCGAEMHDSDTFKIAAWASSQVAKLMDGSIESVVMNGEDVTEGYKEATRGKDAENEGS